MAQSVTRLTLGLVCRVNGPEGNLTALIAF